MSECGERQVSTADFSAFRYIRNCYRCGSEFGCINSRGKFCSSKCKASQYRIDNPHSSSAASRKYRELNPEEWREVQSRYYIKNKEKRKHNSRSWREINPEKVKIHNESSWENKKIKKSQLAALDAISQIRNNTQINSNGE